MRVFLLLLAWAFALWGQGAAPGVPAVAPAVTPGAAPLSSAVAVPVPPPKPVETFQSAMEKQRAAMQVQRESVRMQRELAQEWRQSPALPEAECERLADPELTPLIDRAAQSHQLDSKLLRGVMQQESGFRPCAVSAKGARGLMQLMPATLEQFKVEDGFDPVSNVEAGATYLKQLVDKYKGDLKLALAAYNAGPGAVDRAGAVPDIKETREYVENILKKVQ
ncbi:MAG: lytic transglycosylase domain-containing protein [Candidatus Solibacter sp.]